MKTFLRGLLSTLAALALCGASSSDLTSPDLPEELHCKFFVAWFCYSNGECNDMLLAGRYGPQRAVINFRKNSMTVYDNKLIMRNKIDNLVLSKQGDLIAHWELHGEDGATWSDRLFKAPEGFQLQRLFSNSLNNRVPGDGNWVVYNCPSRSGDSSVKPAP